MNGFIEIKPAGGGNRRLINIRHIEEVMECENGSCIIYFACNAPTGIETYHIKPSQSYEEIKSKIWECRR